MRSQRSLKTTVTPSRSTFSGTTGRQHKAHRLSPAMAAGLTDKLLSMNDLAEMVDAAQPQPGKWGPYKKQIAA